MGLNEDKPIYQALSDVVVRERYNQEYDPLFMVKLKKGDIFTLPNGYNEDNIIGEFKKIKVIEL